MFGACAVWAFMVLCSDAAQAQSRLLTGYLQTVPLWTDQTALTESNISLFNRFRLSSEPVFGPILIGVAYEHVATVRHRSALPGIGIGAVPSGGEWLDLQWTITEEEHLSWQHRFDRLHVGWAPTDTFEITAGRQAVSWGTTLFLTPSDPFAPFSQPTRSGSFVPASTRHGHVSTRGRSARSTSSCDQRSPHLERS